MDVTSAFKSEVLRPLTNWVIPGAIAIAPYLLIAGYYVPSIAAFWDTHPSAAVAVITICTFAAGLVLDDIGSLIETRSWDRILRRKNAEHDREWVRYLKLRLRDELIAQRYLKTLVRQMKFELTMIPALFVFLTGVIWLDRLYDLWRLRGLLFVCAVLLAGTAYFAYESFRSCRILAKVRRWILEAVEAEARAASAPPVSVLPERTS